MTERTVLITGGSSGIGEDLVREFVAGGHPVWFTYHRGRGRAESLVASLGNANVQAFALELGDEASQRAAPTIDIQGSGLKARVRVGKRVVSFDGEKIVLGDR